MAIDEQILDLIGSLDYEGYKYSLKNQGKIYILSKFDDGVNCDVIEMYDSKESVLRRLKDIYSDIQLGILPTLK